MRFIFFFTSVSKLKYNYATMQVKMLSNYLAEMPVDIKKGSNNKTMEERKREKKIDGSSRSYKMHNLCIRKEKDLHKVQKQRTLGW